jgi:hypothetical protein
MAVDKVISISEMNRNVAEFYVLGSTPLIMNRLSEKAKRELMYPSAPKTRADKATKLKHDPVAEYRAAAYLNSDSTRPAYFHGPAAWFKKALSNAGLDMPGAAKAKLERLTAVTSTQIDIFGLPSLSATPVRDARGTPDIRFRPIFAEWACIVQIDYISSLLREQDISALFAAAGLIVGVGDNRPQKGGAFGKFRLVAPDDADFQRVLSEQGRVAQEAAFWTPPYFDAESEELTTWFFDAVDGRDVKFTPIGQPMAEAAE